jgi:nucleotide-binding universal stress UspA family protein
MSGMMFGTRHVIVGYDGSAPAGHAVDWAADEAVRRRQPLEVLHVTGHLSALRGERPADDVTAAGVARARRRQPDVAVTGTTLAGVPRTVLVGAGHRAALLVLGHGGHGGLAGSVLGSLTSAVTVHAACPVALVRGGHTALPGPRHPVVVGVDGTGAALAATRAAAAIAGRSGAVLRIVHATGNSGLGERPGGVTAPARVVAAATAAAHEAAPDTRVERVLARGRPAAVLVQNAADASLVVVGSRGRGGVTGLVLGSVGRGVVHGARCPVLLVTAGAVARAAGDRPAMHTRQA